MISLVNYINESKESISTDAQEQKTVDLFNEFFNKRKIELSDIVFPEEYSYINIKKQKDWIDTWKAQLDIMFNLFSDWSNPICERYGEHSNVAQVIVELHNQIWKKNFSGRSNHDVFDPTDVIVYSKNKENEIVREIKNLLNNDLDGLSLLTAAKALFIKFKNEKMYAGVSLKMGNSLKVTMINYEDIVAFENPVITSMSWSTELYSLTLSVTTNDANINFNIRTSDKSHLHIRILPTIKGSKAQMGDSPKTKWKKSILTGKGPQRLIELISSRNISNDWDSVSRGVIENFLKSLDTSKFIEDTFFNEQCDVIVDIIENGPSTIQQHLLWSEKIDTNGLPYILIGPR